MCLCRHAPAQHSNNRGMCNIYGCTCLEFTPPPGAWATIGKARYAMVYTPSGRVAHILHLGVSPDGNNPAWCGAYPWPLCWRGFSNMEESDRLNALPVCKTCQRHFERKRYAGDHY